MGNSKTLGFRFTIHTCNREHVPANAFGVKQNQEFY